MGHDNCVETWTLADGVRLTLRHIAPADAAREQAFVRGLSPASSYSRFHGTVKELSTKDLEKFTNPDARNAVALIVLRRGDAGDEEIGVARYVIDADQAGCEFAIVVADAWQGRGIGTRLIRALTRHLRASGVKRISGSVLASNAVMRKLAKDLGFVETQSRNDPSLLSVTRGLTDEPTAPPQPLPAPGPAPGS
jgi:acetyltransferase